MKLRAILGRQVSLPVWSLLLVAVVFVGGAAVAANNGGGEPAADQSPAATQGELGELLADQQRRNASSIPPSTRASTTTTSATTTTTGPPQTIGTWSGSSTKKTDNFTVRAPWRISWTITGGAGVHILVRSADGERLESLSTDPGTDESIVRDSCTCYLELEPFGSSYKISVTGSPG